MYLWLLVKQLEEKEEQLALNGLPMSEVIMRANTFEHCCGYSSGNRTMSAALFVRQLVQLKSFQRPLHGGWQWVTAQLKRPLGQVPLYLHLSSTSQLTGHFQEEHFAHCHCTFFSSYLKTFYQPWLPIGVVDLRTLSKCHKNSKLEIPLYEMPLYLPILLHNCLSKAMPPNYCKRWHPAQELSVQVYGVCIDQWCVLLLGMVAGCRMCLA